MVFSMISVVDIDPLVRLHGKIRATVYKEILKKHASNLRNTINKSVVFIQDNVPCYTMKSVESFLSEVEVTVIKCRAESQT